MAWVVAFAFAAAPVVSAAQAQVLAAPRPQLPADVAPAPEAPEARAAAPSAPETSARAPVGADRVMIMLADIVVEGVTRYGTDSLRAIFADRLGANAPLSALYDIAGEVERKYRADGYFLTRAVVPPQEIRGGVARIRVVEGYVRDVTYLVEPDVGPVEAKVRAYVDRILTAAAPHDILDVERWLLLADDVPGIDVSGVLRPARRRSPDDDATGAAELVVSVARGSRGTTRLMADNYGSSFTGETRGVAALSSHSLTALGENVTAAGFATTDFEGFSDGQRSAQVSARLLPGSSGGYVEFFAAYGDSTPTGLEAALDFESDTLFLSAEAGYWVVRSRDRNLRALLRFDYIDSDTDVLGGQAFTRDRLRVLEFGLRGDIRDGWGGATEGGVALRQGLPILGASDGDDPLLSIIGGSATATTIRADASRVQILPVGFSLYGAVAGQYAFDSVLADERFEIGGLRFGRGYDASVLAGDHGVGATAELRYARRFDFDWLRAVEPFAFIDYGKVWSREFDLSKDLSSAGAGVRVFGPEWLSAEFAVAKPIGLDSARAGDGRDPVALFRVFARFDF